MGWSRYIQCIYTGLIIRGRSSEFAPDFLVAADPANMHWMWLDQPIQCIFARFLGHATSSENPLDFAYVAEDFAHVLRAFK